MVTVRMENLERGFDNCFLIRYMIPQSRNIRIKLARAQSQAWWEGFQTDMHTGVYSGPKPINGKPIRVIVTPAPKIERNTWHWDNNTVD
jgi:hypothetical protein